jgi:inorganic triphosphatase YgiF
MTEEQAVEEFQRTLVALENNLRAARQLYLERDDHGREGALRAVQALVSLIESIPGLSEQHLAAPLVALAADLEDVNDDIASPMLQPEKARSAKRRRAQAMRAYIAGAIHLLIKGKEAKDDAVTAVYRHLSKRFEMWEPSTTGTRDITKQTLKSWRDAASGGCPSEDFDADAYRYFLEQNEERFIALVKKVGLEKAKTAYLLPKIELSVAEMRILRNRNP